MNDYTINKSKYLFLRDIARKPELYKYIPIDIPKEVYKFHQTLDVSKTDAYNHYGKIDDFDSPRIMEFLRSIGSNSDKLLRSIYLTMLSTLDTYKSYFDSAYGSDGVDRNSVWVAIRSFEPTDEYKIPRWHHDGGKFWTKVGNENVYKFATALVGPGTLIAQLSPDEYLMVYNEIHDLYMRRYKECKGHEEEMEFEMNVMRPTLQRLIGDKYEYVPQNQGIVFLVDDLRAPIHSEPHIDGPRLFFSIMFATDEQIQERIAIQQNFKKSIGKA
jgi:hypothetical protein